MENESRRWTSSRGELVKINLRQCDGCGAVWVPENQASKVGVSSGWYPNIAEVRQAFESNPAFDPVLRISDGKRGKIVCPDCKD